MKSKMAKKEIKLGRAGLAQYMLTKVKKMRMEHTLWRESCREIVIIGYETAGENVFKRDSYLVRSSVRASSIAPSGRSGHSGGQGHGRHCEPST